MMAGRAVAELWELPRNAAFFCIIVTGQSLWARRSCFNWATSFLRRVTSFWRQPNTNTYFLQALSCHIVKEKNVGVCVWAVARTRPRKSTLTVRVMFMLARSSAFFSKELTQSFLFCLHREAAARFRSRKRCLLSSGSISEARRRRPPVGWAGDTWEEGFPKLEVRYGHRQTPAATWILCLPGAGPGRARQSSGRAAGSVLVSGGQQGWRNLPPPQPHLVFPDLLKLLSVAAKPHKDVSKSTVHLEKNWKNPPTKRLLVLPTLSRRADYTQREKMTRCWPHLPEVLEYLGRWAPSSPAVQAKYHNKCRERETD